VKLKTFILMIIAIVLIGGAIGGAFIGGVAVGKNQEKDARSNFPGQFNGNQNGGTLPTDVPGGNGFIGRGTSGTISKIENGVITLTTQNGSTIIINTSSSTTIQKMEAANLSDISIGESVTVMGETQSDGTINATNISVIPQGMNAMIPPTQTN
jgi:hypothetical protein